MRSQLPTMTLDEGYESKEKMALEIKYPPKLSFSAASICTSSRPIPASASTNHEPEKGDLILLRGLVVVWESKSTEKMALEIKYVAILHARVLEGVAISPFPLKAVVFRSGDRTLVRF